MKVVKFITALKARQNLGELLEEVFYRQDHFVIKRGEKAMAVVIPLSEYEAYRRQREEDFRILDEIRKQTKKSPPGEMGKDILEAVDAARSK